MTTDEKFVSAVKAMEKRTSRVSAAVVINPSNPDNYGRVVISYPADGAGRVHAIAWLPGSPDPINGRESCRHSSSASGFGYDKASAAMSGAAFYNLKSGAMDALRDNGFRWDSQLREAGYLVITAV